MISNPKDDYTLTRKISASKQRA